MPLSQFSTTTLPSLVYHTDMFESVALNDTNVAAACILMSFSAACIFSQPFPVMNVSFAVTDITVSEGECMVTLMLEKSEGAVGPVSVGIFTTAGTALGR